MRAWVAVLALSSAACAPENADESPGGQTDDLTAFAQRAQPPLARNCAFPACHGDLSRGLTLYAVGRTRFIEHPSHAQEQHHPLSVDELEANLQSVLTFVDPRHPDRSELLRRTLPEAEGGRGHRGGVLFLTRSDPEYQALLTWIDEAVEP